MELLLAMEVVIVVSMAVVTVSVLVRPSPPPPLPLVVPDVLLGAEVDVGAVVGTKEEAIGTLC